MQARSQPGLHSCRWPLRDPRIPPIVFMRLSIACMRSAALVVRTVTPPSASTFTSAIAALVSPGKSVKFLNRGRSFSSCTTILAASASAMRSNRACSATKLKPAMRVNSARKYSTRAWICARANVRDAFLLPGLKPSDLPKPSRASHQQRVRGPKLRCRRFFSGRAPGVPIDFKSPCFISRNRSSFYLFGKPAQSPQPTTPSDATLAEGFNRWVQ